MPLDPLNGSDFTKTCYYYFHPEQKRPNMDGKTHQRQRIEKICSYVFSFGLIPLAMGIAYGCSRLNDLRVSKQGATAAATAAPVVIEATDKPFGNNATPEVLYAIQKCLLKARDGDKSEDTRDRDKSEDTRDRDELKNKPFPEGVFRISSDKDKLRAAQQKIASANKPTPEEGVAEPLTAEQAKQLIEGIKAEIKDKNEAIMVLADLYKACFKQLAKETPLFPKNIDLSDPRQFADLFKQALQVDTGEFSRTDNSGKEVHVLKDFIDLVKIAWQDRESAKTDLRNLAIIFAPNLDPREEFKPTGNPANDVQEGMAYGNKFEDFLVVSMASQMLERGEQDVVKKGDLDELTDKERAALREKIKTLVPVNDEPAPRERLASLGSVGSVGLDDDDDSLKGLRSRSISTAEDDVALSDEEDDDRDNSTTGNTGVSTQPSSVNSASKYEHKIEVEGPLGDHHDMSKVAASVPSNRGNSSTDDSSNVAEPSDSVQDVMRLVWYSEARKRMQIAKEATNIKMPFWENLRRACTDGTSHLTSKEELAKMMLRATPIDGSAEFPQDRMGSLRHNYLSVATAEVLPYVERLDNFKEDCKIAACVADMMYWEAQRLKKKKIKERGGKSIDDFDCLHGISAELWIFAEEDNRSRDVVRARELITKAKGFLSKDFPWFG